MKCNQLPSPEAFLSALQQPLTYALVARCMEYAFFNPVEMVLGEAIETSTLNAHQVEELSRDPQRVVRLDNMAAVFAVINLSQAGGQTRVLALRHIAKLPDLDDKVDDPIEYRSLEPGLSQIWAEAFDFRGGVRIVTTLWPEPHGCTVLHQPLSEGQDVPVIVGIPKDVMKQLELGHEGFDPQGHIMVACDKCGSGCWIEHGQHEHKQSAKQAGKKSLVWCHPCADVLMQQGNVFTAEPVPVGLN